MFGSGDLELLLAGLASAQDFARATQAEIFLGYAEAVIGFAHQGEAGAGGFAEGIAAQKDADAVILAPPYPASQLVKLRETEAVSAFYDDEVTVRDIDAHLDNRSGNENPRAGHCEGFHRRVFFRAFHAPMHNTDELAEAKS